MFGTGFARNLNTSNVNLQSVTGQLIPFPDTDLNTSNVNLQSG